MSFASRVCEALTKAGVRYAVVGGYAVALHGAVRGTVDVDFVVAWSLKSLRGVERAMTKMGLVSRLPITAEDLFQFRDEYLRNRNLLAWNFYNPSNPLEQVDLVVDYDLVGKRRSRVTTGDGSIYVLGLEDLIAMKRRSGRAQDLEDVSALERLR